MGCNLRRGKETVHGLFYKRVEDALMHGDYIQAENRADLLDMLEVFQNLGFYWRGGCKPTEVVLPSGLDTASIYFTLLGLAITRYPGPTFRTTKWQDFLSDKDSHTPKFVY